MLVHDDADFSIIVQLSLAHLTTLFRVVKEILYFRNHLLGLSRRQTWTAFCGTFCMQEPLPKVGILLECLWHMHKLQIHKLLSRHDHLNISTMYSVFDWKEFELSQRWAFLESPEITVLLKKQMVWKAPFKFTLSAEIK